MVRPRTWTSGLKGWNNQSHGFNPTNHGNTNDFDPNLYKVLFSFPKVAPNTAGSDIISNASAQIPILTVKVDLGKGRVIGIDRPPEQGKYSDLPVPIF